MPPALLLRRGRAGHVLARWRPCTVGLVDLADGDRFIPVTETRAWNFQEAAMTHWILPAGRVTNRQTVKPSNCQTGDESAASAFIADWLADYAERRYGIRDKCINEALMLLARSVWNVDRLQEGCSETVFCARPKWNVAKSSTWASDQPPYYSAKDVEAAAELYLDVAKERRQLLDLATFRYDFTDVFRQVLSDRGLALVPRLKDSAVARAEFLALIRRMDALLACTGAFRLDTYESRARRRAGERGVRSLRRMFTTWVETPNTNLNDYAHHQLSGLLGNYYLKRRHH